MLFVITIILSVSTLHAQQRKAVNLALEWKGQTKDSVRFSHADVGLMGNITSLRGVNIQALGYMIHDNASGVSIAGLGGYVGGDMNGVQVGTLLNIIKKDLNGVQLGVLPNVVGGYSSGLQMAALGNVTGQTATGLQLSGIENVAKRLNGWQVSVFNNLVTETMTGVQIAAAVNIATNVSKGLQFAGAVNICPEEVRGVQIACANYGTTLRGIQVGLFNLAGPQSSGFQIGLVNISSDSLMHKIGLVNINQHTRIQLMPFVGNTGKLNLGVRFLNPHTYSMTGISTHYMGLDKHFSGALFYRFGLHWKLSPKWRISTDAGYYHIETFEDDAVQPERLYSLQARVNIEYQITHRFAFIGSGGYGITRFYDKEKNYHDKPIVELGVVLF